MIDLKYTFDALRDRGEESFFITLTNEGEPEKAHLEIFSGDTAVEVFLDAKMSPEEGREMIRRLLLPICGPVPPFKDITISYDNFGNGREQLFIGDNDFTFQIVDSLDRDRTEISFRKELNGKGYFSLPEFKEAPDDYHFHYVLKEGDGNIKHEHRHVELF